MRIVLFTMDRLVEFMLPSQVFGTFAFDSNDDEDTKLINIEADNNEWFLYSTTGVRVLDNGNYTYRLKLEINKYQSAASSSVVLRLAMSSMPLLSQIVPQQSFSMFLGKMTS